MYKVTYRNSIDGNRYTLLDGLTKADAENVFSVFGNKNDPSVYMTGCKIEQDDSIREEW